MPRKKNNVTDQPVSTPEEAARIRRALPPVPPGVKMFDPRRIRRRMRARAMVRINMDLSRKLAEQEKAKRALTNLNDRLRREAEHAKTVWGRTKALFRSVFQRGKV